MFSTSIGLTKTVYNPAALKAAQKTSEEALKKKQVRRSERFCNWDKGFVFFFPINIIFIFSQEALRLQQDVRKKKQEILEKHIETQKVSSSPLDNFSRVVEML